MSCRLILDKDNKVNGVFTLSGDVSELYPALLERTKDKQNSAEVTILAQTDRFAQNVVKPLLSKYQATVRAKLDTLKPEKPSIQLVHKGEEFTIDVQKLSYKTVEVNGFQTIQAYAKVGEEQVMLGKVRLKAYKEGLSVESSNLGTSKVYVDGNLEGLAGKGIGTEIYKNAINYALKQGRPFYSDAAQTESATGVWEKLKTTGAVKRDGDRNKIEAYPSTHFDKNQEVLPKVVIKYILGNRSKGKELNAEQKQEIRNALLTLPFEDSLEMNEGLQKAFFTDGEFVVDPKKLRDIYNDYEIAAIMSSKEVQSNIKNILKALNNSQEVIKNDVYFDKKYLTQTSEINSLGKMVNNNPLATEQELVQALGGISDEQSFADILENFEIPVEMGSTTPYITEVEVEVMATPVETVTPESSSNYANMTEDGQGNFVFYHYSDEKRDFIDPKKYGSNNRNITSNGEKEAIAMVDGVAMFYTSPKDVEKGIGPVKHMIKVAKSEVYDFNSDKLGFIELARDRFNSEHPGKAFNANVQLAYVTQVARDNGYKMVVAEWSGKSRAQTVSELSPVDTQENLGDTIVKPFKENYEGNREKGYVAVIPQYKADMLQAAYVKMNSELNAKNNYGPLYHLYGKSDRPSQETITQMVAEAPLSEEVKEEYRAALGYVQEDRRSIQKRGVEIQMDKIVENANAEIERVRGLPVADMDGGTFNIDGSTYEGGGLVVPVVSQNYAQSEITAQKLLEFVEKHKDKIPEGSTIKVGIFKFEGKPEVSLDLNIIVAQDNRDVAIAFGKAAGQFSLFDLDALKRGDWNNTDIKTGATGESPVEFSTEEFVEIANALSEGKTPESVGKYEEASPNFKLVLNENIDTESQERIAQLISEAINNPEDTVVNVDKLDDSVITQAIDIDSNDKRPEASLMSTLRIPLDYILGKNVGIGMSDTLTTGEREVDVMDTTTGEISKQTLREEGGIGYPFKSLIDLMEGTLSGGFKAMGWAAVNASAATKMVNSAKKADKITGAELKEKYFKAFGLEGDSLTAEQQLKKDRLNEAIPDSKEFGLVAIYKMGADGIRSNVAYIREAFRMIETKLSAEMQEELFVLAKERLNKVAWKNKDTLLAELNKTKNFLELEEALHGKSSKLSLDARQSILKTVFLADETKTTNKVTNPVGYFLKERGISLQSVAKDLEESVMDGVDVGQPMLMLAIDPTAKTIEDKERKRHSNYPFGVEGFPIGILETTAPFQNLVPDMMDAYVKNSTTIVDDKATKKGEKGSVNTVVKVFQKTDGKYYAQEGSGSDKTTIGKKGENLKNESSSDNFLVEDTLLALVGKLKKFGYKLSADFMDRYKPSINGSMRSTITKSLGQNEDLLMSMDNTPQQKLVMFLQKAFPNINLNLDQGTYDESQEGFVGKKLLNKGGKSYGFVFEGGVSLNPTYLNNNTPIHEYGHIWNAVIKEERPEIHKKGMELVEESKYFTNVLEDASYQKVMKVLFGKGILQKNKITGKLQLDATSANYESARYFVGDEALAKAIGDRGENFVNEAQKRAFKNWWNTLMDALKSLVGFESMAKEEIGNLTFDGFVDAAVKEILSGKKVTGMSSTELANSSKNGQYKFSIAERAAPKKRVVDKSLFNEMQEYKRMPQYKLKGGELVKVVKNDPRVIMEQAADLEDNAGLLGDIAYLAELDDSIYEENPEEVQALIKEVEKKAARQGVDIIGLSERAYQGRDAVHNLLVSLHSLTLEPSQENLETYIADHNQVFGSGQEESEKVSRVGSTNLKKSLIHLNTKTSEYQLFANNNLVKVADGTYQVVEKSESLTELYDKLYQVAQYNERVLPLTAFPLANEGGALNLSTIRNAENKEIILKDIQTFIENEVTALDLSDKNMDNKVLQELVAFKYFFNNPLVSKPTANIREEFDNFNTFSGDEYYLVNDFVSDFHKEYLVQKADKTQLFEDFYSKFSITEDGLTLDASDDISVRELKEVLKTGEIAMAEDLMNYSLLTKQMPNLKDTDTAGTEYTRDFQRAFYANSPSSLTKLAQDYSLLTPTTISVKDSLEGFVRVNSGVYELMDQRDNVGFYEKVKENTSPYNTFEVQEPMLSVDASEYGADALQNIEVVVESKKYYSKSESSKIDDENFGCL